MTTHLRQPKPLRRYDPDSMAARSLSELLLCANRDTPMTSDNPPRLDLQYRGPIPGGWVLLTVERNLFVIWVQLMPDLSPAGFPGGCRTLALVPRGVDAYELDRAKPEVVTRVSEAIEAATLVRARCCAAMLELGFQWLVPETPGPDTVEPEGGAARPE